MIERKTILLQLATDKRNVINDNSDVFSSCKYGSQFHKFFPYKGTEDALNAETSQVIYEAETGGNRNFKVHIMDLS